jgi:hypothetical protein
MDCVARVVRDFEGGVDAVCKFDVVYKLACLRISRFFFR